MSETAPPALSIVIPTWNGRELLARFLPPVAEEAARWSAAQTRAVEIVVSDDGSSDGTSGWLAAEFPSVRCVGSGENRGFAPAANAGVAAARAPVVVLLNNDLALLPYSLDPVERHFDDPELFGVTLRALDLPALTFATGGKLGRFRRGFWETWRNFEHPAGPTFMLVGGFCAFRRGAFLDLGGFDPLFAPYYSEDLDLSYRARKRGWKLAYEPAALVHHAQSASVRRHASAQRRAAVIERNRLLFHWRNLDPPRLRRHALWAGLLLLQAPFKGNWAYHRGFVQALRGLGGVRRFRRAERPFWRRDDLSLALPQPPGAGPAAT